MRGKPMRCRNGSNNKNALDSARSTSLEISVCNKNGNHKETNWNQCIKNERTWEWGVGVFIMQYAQYKRNDVNL